MRKVVESRRRAMQGVCRARGVTPNAKLTGGKNRQKETYE
jgi:hypothetical protein